MGEGTDALWEWLGLATETDREAFRDRLRNACQGILTRLNCRHVDAADVVQESFARLLGQLVGLTGGEVKNPRGFLHGIAKNVAHELCRHGRRFDPLNDDYSIVDSFADEERALECLEDCLQRLDGQTRLMLTGYYAEPSALAREKQAAALGIKVNALRVRIHTLKRRLRLCIADCLDSRRSGGDVN